MYLNSRSVSYLAAFTLLLTFLAIGQPDAVGQTTYVWNTPLSGDWDGANWNPAGPAGGTGNTADFNTQNIDGFADVGLDTDVTIGHLVFGDTDPNNTPGLWTLYDNSFDPNVGTITRTLTLSDPNTTPSITANVLGVIDPNGVAGGPYDDTLINLNLAGTQGFVKNGGGILTLGGTLASGLGTIRLKAGTLRTVTNADLNVITAANVPSVSMADGTRLEIRGVQNTTVHDIVTDANATVTIRTNHQTFLRNIQGSGSGTLNLELASNRNNYGYGDWTVGGGWDVVNMSKTGGGNALFRMRPVGGQFNTFAFNGAVLNMNGVEHTWQDMWSGGDDFPMMALNGDATSRINGAPNLVNYRIGDPDPNSTSGPDGNFRGIVGGGAIGIEKVGQNTQTFSGTFDAGFGGRGIRVTQGTLQLGGTTTIPGGTEAEPTFIDVRAGGTLDLTDPNSATDFSLANNARLTGAGTIIVSGAGTRKFNHSGGDLAPGDVVSDTRPTNNYTSTAGTMTLTGNMTFSGGGIAYDMSLDPNTGNDLVIVTGSSSVAGGGIIRPNFLAGTPDPNLIYTVMESQGGYSDSLSGWSVNWFGRGAAPSPFLDGNLLKFKTTEVGAVGSVTWTGVSGGDPNGTAPWVVQDPNNDDWLLSGSPDDFFQGDHVSFPEAGVTTFNVSIEESVTPSSTTVDSTTDYTFTGNGGSIDGSGSLTKRGSSTLNVNGVNTYSGGTTIENGHIVMSDGGSLGLGSLTFANNDPNNTVSVTTVNSASTLSGIVLNGFGDNRMVLNHGTSWEGPGLSGLGSITYATDDNDERLDLNGVDPNFAGFVTFGADADGDPNTVSHMTVRMDDEFNDFPNASITLVNGATLTHESGSSYLRPIELGALTGEAGTTLTPFVGGGSVPGTNWVIGGLNANTEFAGNIIDGGNNVNDPNIPAQGYVTKVGSGELILSGANTYTGDTTVEDGTLSITSDFLADTADVYLSTGSIFDLDFVATDVIDSLFIDGIAQVIGTWGAVGSGADNETSLITGTGLLSVTTQPFLPGDVNQDGRVDALDFLQIQRTNPALIPTWEANYGQPVTSNTTAVPEPGSALLCVAAMAGLSLVRKRSV